MHTCLHNSDTITNNCNHLECLLKTLAAEQKVIYVISDTGHSQNRYREDLFPSYPSMALEEKLAAEEEEEDKLTKEVDAEAKELELDDDCELDADASDDDFSQLVAK